MNTLIVITGPTAVGKTALTLQLAKHYGIPVVNADSRQVYRDMPIGTAAPTAAEQAQVKHYFVGTLGLDDYYSASMYEQDVMRLLEGQLFKQSDVALLSGGSMMYIDAVCDGIDDIPTITPEMREHVKRLLADEGLEGVGERLRKLDPEYYDIVDRKNTRRVVHGLEICLQTGQTYTSFRTRTRKPRPFRTVKVVLNRPRDILYDRINRRVDAMVAEGFLDEAKALYPHREANALNTVGYKELFAYLDGTWSLDEAVERIKGNTRRYARKQLTWYKKDPSATWLDLENADINSIINHISEL